MLLVGTLLVGKHLEHQGACQDGLLVGMHLVGMHLVGTLLELLRVGTHLLVGMRLEVLLLAGTLLDRRVGKLLEEELLVGMHLGVLLKGVQ